MGEKILAEFIIEILGRPADYVEKALKEIIDRMGSEKGIEIKNKRIRAPKKLENRELFTAFAEVEAEFDNLGILFSIVFAYMPSNVEIIKPVDFRVSNSEISGMVSEIIRKLHKYDEVAKRIFLEKSILEAKLEELTEKYNISFEELKTPPKLNRAQRNKKTKRKTKTRNKRNKKGR